MQTFRDYVRIALGSAHEVMVLLDFGRDLGYMSVEEYQHFTEGYLSVIKRLKSLMKALKSG